MEINMEELNNTKKMIKSFRTLISKSSEFTRFKALCVVKHITIEQGLQEAITAWNEKTTENITEKK